MALDAVVNIKGVLAFPVAGAACLALFQSGHGSLVARYAEGEDLGVTVGTLVCLQVEFVAEGGFAGRFGDHVVDDARFHAFVASAAVAGGGEDVLAVVAAAA